MKNSILSTRPLSPALVAEAKGSGISIDEISFIETQPIRSKEVMEEVEKIYQQEATVVFTSMSGVDAVTLRKNPAWKIYCLDHATKQAVIKKFGDNIVGTADSAEELAWLIAKGNAKEITFFCGDHRREELPAILKKNTIRVNEVVVYKTIPQHHTIEKRYDGILFFSPSAVESFFKTNKLNSETILFAIGNTTAAAIKEQNNNKVIISKNPAKEAMVREVIKYYSEL